MFANVYLLISLIGNGKELLPFKDKKLIISRQVYKFKNQSHTSPAYDRAIDG